MKKLIGSLRKVDAMKRKLKQVAYIVVVSPLILAIVSAYGFIKLMETVWMWAEDKKGT